MRFPVAFHVTKQNFTPQFGVVYNIAKGDYQQGYADGYEVGYKAGYLAGYEAGANARPPDVPDVPDIPDVPVKLEAPVIQLVTVGGETPDVPDVPVKLSAPVIYLQSDDEQGGDSGSTSAILGIAILGRAILGSTSTAPKLPAPVIYLDSSEEPEEPDVPGAPEKLAAPVIELVEEGAEEPDVPDVPEPVKLGTPEIHLELEAPVATLDGDILSWNAVDGASAYMVISDNANDGLPLTGGDEPLSLVAGTDTTTTNLAEKLSGNEPGQRTIYVQALAYGNSGYSGLSNGVVYTLE